MIGFYANILHKKCDISVAIEQKGMNFDHDFATAFSFLLPLFLGGKRKGEKKTKVEVESHAFLLDHHWCIQTRWPKNPVLICFRS